MLNVVSVVAPIKAKGPEYMAEEHFADSFILRRTASRYLDGKVP